MIKVYRFAILMVVMVLVPFLLLPFALKAFAHSGRTDSSGGHNDRKNGGYHYHNSGRSSSSSLASQGTSARCAYMMTTCAAVRKENAELKQHNDFLVQLLIDNNIKVPSAGKSRYRSIGNSITKSQSVKTHWITNSSSKRHNSRCRYFKNSNGRMCGPNDGIACKICGG